MTAARTGGSAAVCKAINANPGLKVNRSIKISGLQMFFTGFVLYTLRLFKLKTDGKTICRKPQGIVGRLNFILSFNLGYLDRALNNPAQEGPLLGLAKSIYYVYVINRTIHCCLRVWIFSFRVQLEISPVSAAKA